MKETFLLLVFLFLDSFFGDPDDVTSVSVMEGQSVTLNTDTDLQTDDLILWWFLKKHILVAQFNRVTSITSFYNDASEEGFRDRLQVDHQTGSLTITNISTQHTGLYQVEIINSRKPSYKRFNVTVHVARVVNSSMTKQTSSGVDPSFLTIIVCDVVALLIMTVVVIFSWYGESRRRRFKWPDIWRTI